jgi:hypothetical protein
MSNNDYPEDTVLGNDSEEDDEEELQSEQEEAVGEAVNTGRVVHLLPVHAAPNTGKNKLTVSRSRGRPRKVERMPTTSDLEYHARMTEAKASFIDQDPIVRAASKHTEPMAMLAVIRTEVAKESAALHFQRIENEKFGKDTAQVSSRRIDALKKIADIELELKKMGADVIDVHSEKFQRIFKLWIDTIREIAEETMNPQQIDLFFNRLTTSMEGWEEKAAEVLR